MLIDFDMVPNITLEEYLDILKRMKQAALDDMKYSSEEGKKEDIFRSFWGIQLRYRDDADCLYADCCSLGYQHFTKFYPYLWEYMKNESESFLEDSDDFDEPIENKFYWKVTRFVQIKDQIYELYETFFSLYCDLLCVQGNSLDFDTKWDKKHLKEFVKWFSAEQKYIIENTDQLLSPLNVILPYQPGDILYVEGNPFVKPFYAVYCAETSVEKDHFEWTVTEYGHYRREHPCLYFSNDENMLDFTDLTGHYLSFRDDSPFPYTPLDRIKVVDTCDNSYLLQASRMLKENPSVFDKWRKCRDSHELLDNEGF